MTLDDINKFLCTVVLLLLIVILVHDVLVRVGAVEGFAKIQPTTMYTGANPSPRYQTGSQPGAGGYGRVLHCPGRGRTTRGRRLCCSPDRAGRALSGI